MNWCMLIWRGSYFHVFCLPSYSPNRFFSLVSRIKRTPSSCFFVLSYMFWSWLFLFYIFLASLPSSLFLHTKAYRCLGYEYPSNFMRLFEETELASKLRLIWRSTSISKMVLSVSILKRELAFMTNTRAYVGLCYFIFYFFCEICNNDSSLCLHYIWIISYFICYLQLWSIAYYSLYLHKVC